jgi:hypothetical protein
VWCEPVGGEDVFEAVLPCPVEDGGTVVLLDVAGWVAVAVEPPVTDPEPLFVAGLAGVLGARWIEYPPVGVVSAGSERSSDATARSVAVLLNETPPVTRRSARLAPCPSATVVEAPPSAITLA